MPPYTCFLVITPLLFINYPKQKTISGSGSTTTMTTIVMIVTIILAIGTIVLVVNFYKCYKSNQNPNNVMSERTRVQTNQLNHEINNADTTNGGKDAKDIG